MKYGYSLAAPTRGSIITCNSTAHKFNTRSRSQLNGSYRVRLSHIYNKHESVLWELGSHKSSVLAFITEIDEVMIAHSITSYDDDLIDFLIVYFRKKGNSNATINRKLSALYKLLRKAERSGIITKLPSYVRLPEKNQRIRFLTKLEEEMMFDLIRVTDELHADLCIFLIDSGARVGEALALKHGDIVNGRATFWITKSGKSRTVPLTERAQRIIEKHRMAAGGPFAAIKYQRFLYHWHQAKKQCGLEKDKQVVPHILRHTCASRLVQAGIDLRRVQTFLGHQNIQMTLRYAHLATNDLDQCVAALDTFNGPSEIPCVPTMKHRQAEKRSKYQDA